MEKLCLLPPLKNIFYKIRQCFHNLKPAEKQRPSSLALVEQVFYHDCSPKDIAFAKPQSVATLATPVHVADSIME